MKITQLKETRTPKTLSLNCYQGYAYAKRCDDVEFIIMASNRTQLRKAWDQMNQAFPIDMYKVKKVIIAGVK